MTRKDFLKFVETRDFARADILLHKGHAYSGDEDAFNNFKRNGERLGLTKYQILLVYMSKHIDAITQAIKDQPHMPVDRTEGMTGRIDDIINYLNLLAGMLEDDTAKVAPSDEVMPAPKQEEDIPF